MKIIRAQHLGMCFGVRDAIAMALSRASQESLTILGELVHNESVIDTLRRKGIRIENQVENVDTRIAMVTAHGASERTIQRARSRGLDVVEATCPLVHFAHQALRDLVRAGYHPVIIGQRDHVEVRGMTEDLVDYDVILTESDVEQLAERPRFGVVAQTTQPIGRVRHLESLLRRRFVRSDVRFADTVCQPTKQRQTSAAELARVCDVVVVIGGIHSNNTRELVATCRRDCARVWHVQNDTDLKSEWFTARDVVGITAGTSTPDAVIDAVQARLEMFSRQPDFRSAAVRSEVAAEPILA